MNLMAGGNIIDLGTQVDAKVAALLEDLPYGVEIFRVASQDTVVAKSVNDFTSNLMQAVVIVLVTMLAMLPAATGSATEGTVELSFDKELVDPIGMIWEGTVDASGSIQAISLTGLQKLIEQTCDWCRGGLQGSIPCHQEELLHLI